MIDVQILAFERHEPEQELACKVAWRGDARGVPSYRDLIAYIPSRGCRWARDLRTDNNALHKRNSLNEDEDVKEDEGKKGHDCNG